MTQFWSLFGEKWTELPLFSASVFICSNCNSLIFGTDLFLLESYCLTYVLFLSHFYFAISLFPPQEPNVRLPAVPIWQPSSVVQSEESRIFAYDGVHKGC